MDHLPKVVGGEFQIVAKTEKGGRHLETEVAGLVLQQACPGKGKDQFAQPFERLRGCFRPRAGERFDPGSGFRVDAADAIGRFRAGQQPPVHPAEFRSFHESIQDKEPACEREKDQPCTAPAPKSAAGNFFRRTHHLIVGWK